MNVPLPTMTHVFADVPVQRIVEAGGLYIRSFVLEDVGTLIHQHVHDHAHVTLVMHGKVRGWNEGQWIGDKSAGDCFEILAHQAHAFQALEPQTRLACIHDIASALSLAEKGF